MPSGEDAGPDSVEVHRLLGNWRRMVIIRYLALYGSDARVEVRELARVVRALETGQGPTAITTSEYESAYNSLIQNHLPQLAAAGVIEYDDRGKVVSPNELVSRYSLMAALTDQLL